MTKNHVCRTPSNNQQGAVAVMVAFCLVLLVGITALAVDIGYLYASRNELQNVADAAALAGARYIGEVYSYKTEAEIASYSFAKQEVLDQINETANKNKAGNEAILIAYDDVSIGQWIPTLSTEDIYPTEIRPDAVSAIARRDNSVIAGPIITFFARVFNVNSIDVTSRKAIAALTGPATMDEAELLAPFGVSQLNKCFFREPPYTPEAPPTIVFHPEGTCAAWHDFIWPDNQSDMPTTYLRLIRDHPADGSWISGEDWIKTNWNMDAKDWEKFNKPIEALIGGEAVPDSYVAGEDFNFQNNAGGNLFNNGSYIDPTKPYDGNYGTLDKSTSKTPMAAAALFDFFRFRDGDGDNTRWRTIAPVYEEFGVDFNDCKSTSGPKKILGYAVVDITNYDVGAKSFNVDMNCQLVVEDDRGGGTTYGNLRGKIPNLVK